MAKMLVQITADDIRRGAPVSSSGCPLALRLQALTGQDWRVSCSHAWLPGDRGMPKPGTSIKLPAAAIRFVADVDANRPANPVWFELEIPDV
ncbi:MAG: hypothetical protein ACRD24_14955 [Terriglobales bacterium]